MKLNLKLFNKSFGVEAFEKANRADLPGSELFWKSARERMLIQEGELTEVYPKSHLVYVNISRIAQSIAGVNRKFYTGTFGKPEEQEEVRNTEFDKLFSQPAELMSFNEILEATLTFWLYRGKAFIYMFGRKNLTQIPQALIPINPDYVEPIIDKQTKRLSYWSIKRDGVEEAKIAPWDMLFFKFVDPTNPYSGVSPLEAVMTHVQNDWYMNRFNSKFFKNGAFPSGVITFPESYREPNEEEKKYLEKLNQEERGGIEKMFKLMTLWGSATYQSMNVTQKEMAFLEGLDYLEQTVNGIFGTNSIFLGKFEKANAMGGNVAETAITHVWENNLLPKMNYIDWKLWDMLFSKINGGRIWSTFDFKSIKALQRKLSDKINDAQKLFAMNFPINDINQKLELGFDVMPWGDEPLVNPILAPISQVISGEAMQSLNQPIQELPAQRSHKSLIFTASDIKNQKMFLLEQLPLEKGILGKSGLQNELKKFFESELQRVIDNLDKIKKSSEIEQKDLVDDLLNWNGEINGINKVIQPWWELSLQSGAKLMARKTGNASFSFNPLDPKMVASLQWKIKNIPPELIETTKSRLEVTLREGIAQQETITELSYRVEEVFDGRKNNSMSIARTETAGMINTGQFNEMLNEGFNNILVITAGDENRRTPTKSNPFDHTDWHLKIYPANEIIPGHSVMYPGDSENGIEGDIINCRCTFNPVR